MNSAWVDNLVAWIGTHPVAAGLVIFLIAFCDSLVVVGMLVPALPLLFAVGALIGLGHVDGVYAVLCAAAGAFIGDGLCYWAGWRWGPQMRENRLFRRYPQLIARSENLFRRHGAKSIVIARFVGAVRPFVPAIAGMMRMPFKRYGPPSAVAALSWAAIFLAPGWVFGASYDAVAAVADRLALALLALLVALGLVWALVLYTWRWFADRTDSLLARMLRWTSAHPHLGRYAAAVIDPQRPESPALAVLAVCLFAFAWAWFALLGMIWMRGEPLPLDLHVHSAMLQLRNPLADRLMAALAGIGDLRVLLPPMLLGLGFLTWRRRWSAATHWLAAIAFGFVLSHGLRLLVHMPSPPTAPPGFGFPSAPVTMTAIVFGFFAVLIARELPGRNRVWPYLLGGVVVTLLGFARLYLGAHWFSDVLAGVLFGGSWVLLLGIAYRRRVDRSFWMQPLALLFYLGFLATALWHTPRASARLLAQFTPPRPHIELTTPGWWQHQQWRRLPAWRDANQHWPLDVQVAGPLHPLQARLQAQGWRPQAQADWMATLGLLDDDVPPSAQPILPATLDTQPEALLLRRDADDGRSTHVLRLWQTPARLDGDTPVWVGGTQTLYHQRPFGLFGLWLPGKHAPDAAHRVLADALRRQPGLKSREVPASQTERDRPQTLLQIDTRQAKAANAEPPV